MATEQMGFLEGPSCVRNLAKMLTGSAELSETWN
jgi:hypothetical protein